MPSAEKRRIRGARAKKRETAGAAKAAPSVLATPLDVLRAARKLLTPERAWIQGSFAGDKKREGVPLFGHAGNILKGRYCWCAAGALRQTVGHQYNHLAEEAERLLSQAAGGADVFDYNDKSDRAHPEILSWFDRAIKLAKAGA